MPFLNSRAFVYEAIAYGIHVDSEANAIRPTPAHTHNPDAESQAISFLKNALACYNEFLPVHSGLSLAHWKKLIQAIQLNHKFPALRLAPGI